MINNSLYAALQIRYVKLHFKIMFLNDETLPVNKVSALRGGMGEMLLRANCIRDRQCSVCDFEEECIVRRTMYSKFKQKPEYVREGGESIGYVLECENYHTHFAKGDLLEFQLLLFGNTIVYLNLFLQAFYALGLQGIGVENAKFQVLSVTNTKKKELLSDGSIYMENYTVQPVSDYVDFRLEQFRGKNAEGRMIFKTPLTLKYRGGFLQEFEMNALIESVKRRIYMMACYEGIQTDFFDELSVQVSEILFQEHRFVKVKRYSSRQGNFMFLKGIEGSIQTDGFSEDVLYLLLAGELIHIGKNTSFGFGRYQIR